MADFGNILMIVCAGPLVKLMMNALKSSGCPFDIRRHVSCEICDTSVTGGYDQELNQVRREFKRRGVEEC